MESDWGGMTVKIVVIYKGRAGVDFTDLKGYVGASIMTPTIRLHDRQSRP